MYRPITKIPEEEYKKMMEEKLEEKLKPLDKEILSFKEALAKEAKEKESKDVAVKLAALSVTKIDPEIKPVPKVGGKAGGERDEDDEISCPTCHKGHIHKLGIDGITATCTDCGKKSFISPEDADSNCTTCGLAFKRPDENSKYKVNECPRCKNITAEIFNLEELKKRDMRRRVLR